MEPQPGDIILYPVTGQSNWISRLIGAAQLIIGIGKGYETYSHVAILAPNGRQYEAKWPRTGNFLIDDSRVFEVWSLGNLTDAQRRQVLMWCRCHVGEWYNMIGLLTGGLFGLPRTAVCSQFAGHAYESAGVSIHQEGLAILSPDAIPDFPEARMLRRYQPGSRRLL